jgi:pimeloyl-ACP methyl ester carboxylesterase
MHEVTLNDGTVIGYKKKGSGPPLVLVHGGTADHTRWSPISPRFEQHFSVYTMDRRGRGGSGDSPHYDLMREAEDVAAVVDAIGEPASLLGHSYGAVCSLEAALLTNQLRRLILYEPPLPTGIPSFPLAMLDRIQALVDRGKLEAALEMHMVENVKMPAHELAVYRQLPMWNARISLAPTIVRELAIDRTYHFDAGRFAKLQVPTMLLLGGDSPPLFRQATELIDSALPDSRVVILPGERHIAMDTNPDLFVREVLTFLMGPT